MGGDGFIAHYQWRLPVHVPIELATVSMPFCYHCGLGLGAMHQLTEAIWSVGRAGVYAH